MRQGVTGEVDIMQPLIQAGHERYAKSDVRPAQGCPLVRMEDKDRMMGPLSRIQRPGSRRTLGVATMGPWPRSQTDSLYHVENEITLPVRSEPEKWPAKRQCSFPRTTMKCLERNATQNSSAITYKIQGAFTGTGVDQIKGTTQQ